MSEVRRWCLGLLLETPSSVINYSICTNLCLKYTSAGSFRSISLLELCRVKDSANYKATYLNIYYISSFLSPRLVHGHVDEIVKGIYILGRFLWTGRNVNVGKRIPADIFDSIACTLNAVISIKFQTDDWS